MKDNTIKEERWREILEQYPHMKKLKPCPSCGNKQIISYFGTIHGDNVRDYKIYAQAFCTNCHASVDSDKYTSTTQEALERVAQVWNAQ